MLQEEIGTETTKVKT